MLGKKLFSFGHGYSAQALERLLARDGWDVTGLTRSAEKAQKMRSRGTMALIDGQDDIQAELASSSHLLISAAPSDAGDPMLTHHRDALRAAMPNLKWIGYLSTTGVYGDHGGLWVDENTPATPLSQRGKLRAQAEHAWQELADEHAVPLSIFRLAGIYGPSRGPFSKIKAGTARQIIKEGQYFSRIHVEDIAGAVFASMNAPNKSGIYNLCDDMPAPPQDVLKYAAGLLNMPLPAPENIEDAQMSVMARSFYAESKRVRNDKIKHTFGYQLKYPDYVTGLEALFKLENAG